MAIPTTQKECTTRRIASLIIGLWDKVKNAFLLKTSRGAANGVASLDANGKVPSSQLPIAETGNPYNPIYINSNKEFVASEFFCWNQVRNDSLPTALISWGCQSKLLSHTNAEASTSGYVRYIKIDGSIGGIYYITGTVPSSPCHLTLQLGAFSYGTTYYKVLDYSGYNARVASLTHLYMNQDSNGHYVYYVKFKSTIANLDANAVKINVWSSNNSSTVTCLTQSEFDALGTMTITVPLWTPGDSDNIFPQSQRLWYNTLPYVYGYGGNASTPVYIDSKGEIHECTGPFSASQLPSNSSSSAGIVASGSGQYTKSWMTDDNGNPAWRDIQGIKFKEIGLSSTNKDNLNDLSSINQICAYEWSYNNNGNVLNKPANDACSVLSFGFPTASYAIQVAMDGNDNENSLLIRYKKRSTWGSWSRMRDASWILTGIISRDRLPSNIPYIEHVTTIPVNPTVGTIYAL